MGAKRIATDSPNGDKGLATDGTTQRKSSFLAWNIHYKHKDGGTRIFSPDVLPCMRENGETMLQLTVQMLGLMERLGRKALEIEHKVRTGVELPTLAAAELASKAGARGLYYTVADHAPNESALNRLLSQWLGSDVARLGCGMHAVENPTKAALSTLGVLAGMGERLSALAEAEGVAVETLRPLPTEAEMFAGKPGEAGLKKATEVLKSTMGSILGTYVEERRATFKAPSNLHQQHKAKEVRIAVRMRVWRQVLRAWSTLAIFASTRLLHG